MPARLPLLLEPAGARRQQGRALHRRLAARPLPGRGARRHAGPPVGRRAGIAARPRRPRGALRRRGPLHQPHHLGDRRHAAARRGPVGGRARPRPALDPGRRRRERRPHRGIPRRLGQEARGGGRGRAGRPAPHHQRRHPPRQRGPRRRRPGAGGGMGRAPRRDRPRAILRLGEAQPRGPHAVPRRGARRHRRDRAAEGAPCRHHRGRPRDPGLPREIPEGLHGRLGAAADERDAERPRPAVPRGGIDPRPGILVGAGARVGRDLGGLAGLPRLSRHGLDGRALRLVPAQGGRLRRLPLPSAGPDRRRPQRRPGVPPVALPRPDRQPIVLAETEGPVPDYSYRGRAAVAEA